MPYLKEMEDVSRHKPLITKLRVSYHIIISLYHIIITLLDAIFV